MQSQESKADVRKHPIETLKAGLEFDEQHCGERCLGRKIPSFTTFFP